MSMSVYLTGIKPPDEKFKKMLQIYNLCAEAKIDPPEEVSKFFEYDEPCPKGVLVSIEHTEESSIGCRHYDVDLTTLPPDVKILRFTTSW